MILFIVNKSHEKAKNNDVLILETRFVSVAKAWYI